MCIKGDNASIKDLNFAMSFCWDCVQFKPWFSLRLKGKYTEYVCRLYDGVWILFEVERKVYRICLQTICWCMDVKHGPWRWKWNMCHEGGSETWAMKVKVKHGPWRWKWNMGHEGGNETWAMKVEWNDQWVTHKQKKRHAACMRREDSQIKGRKKESGTG